MTINEIIERLGAKCYSVPNGEQQITGGYCGDFLSFVMSRASQGCAWFTIMSNVNVCAVACLAEVGVIIVCEGVVPDKALVKKSIEQEVALIGTDLPIYEACLKIAI